MTSDLAERYWRVSPLALFTELVNTKFSSFVIWFLKGYQINNLIYYHIHIIN